MLVGIAMATGLLVGLSATEALAPKAAAVDYVSSRYTAPKKGQSGSHVVALQRRLRAAGVLKAEYVTGYFGTLTESGVKRFQRNVGLQQTGKVSRRTCDVLVAKTGKVVIKSPQKRTVKLPPP